MDAAIESVLTQHMPIRTAARVFDVSRDSLRRRLEAIKRHEIKDDIGQNQDLMNSAVQAVKVDKLKIRTAASIFAVPESSLRDRIAGRPTRRGHLTKFTEIEEKVLVEILLVLSRIGMPLTKAGLMRLVVTAGKMKGNFLLYIFCVLNLD